MGTVTALEAIWPSFRAHLVAMVGEEQTEEMILTMLYGNDL